MRVWIAVAIAGAVLAGWNYYFFEQLLAALIFYSAVTIPLLMLVFVLVIAEEAGIQGLARMARLFPRLRRGLQASRSTSVRRDTRTPIRPLAFTPRFMHELHKVSKDSLHLPTRRHAA